MSVEAGITPARTSGAAQAVDRINRALRRYAIFLILALIVLFNVAEPAFLRINNLFSVLQSVAVVALLGIGVFCWKIPDGLRAFPSSRLSTKRYELDSWGQRPRAGAGTASRSGTPTLAAA